MTLLPAGGGSPPQVVASRPCRNNECKRVALPESPWCPWDFRRLVSGAYTPKNEAVAMDAYVKRTYGR